MAHWRRSIHPYWMTMRTKQPHYACWCETVTFRVLIKHREETDSKGGWTHLSPVWHSSWWVPAILWEIGIWLLNCYNKELLWFSQPTESPCTCINKLLHSPAGETFIHHPEGLSHVLVMPSDSAPFSSSPSAIVNFLSLCSLSSLLIHTPCRCVLDIAAQMTPASSGREELFLCLCH